MKRYLLKKLESWKNHPNRKPLVLLGARQVGKTWLLQHFAKNNFENTLYINFEKEKSYSEIFKRTNDPHKIIQALEAITQKKISKEDVIIFDEIQGCKEALRSLKYFKEQAPEYYVLSAGSHLGISVNNDNDSFPVGSVDMQKLYPMSFFEFLEAMNHTKLVEIANRLEPTLIAALEGGYIEQYHNYLLVGGMPECVSCFASSASLQEVRVIQNNLLGSYQLDMSKHAPHSIVPKLLQIINSLPTQLVKENKKFMYGKVKYGGRSKEYEHALLWLQAMGYVSKVTKIKKPELPLSAYEDSKSFKLFYLDVGLFCAQSEVPIASMYEGNAVGSFMGAITEQYTQQELAHQNLKPYYWGNNNGQAEVDFIVQVGNNIIPLEVKASINLKSKSLNYYKEKYSPHLIMKVSKAPFRHQPPLLHLPLYLLGVMQKIVMI